MRKWLLGAVLVALAGGVGLFAYRNAEGVSIDLYVAAFTAPLSLLLSLAFAAGVLLTMLVLWPRSLWRRRRIARLGRELERARVELKSLRNRPLQSGGSEA